MKEQLWVLLEEEFRPYLPFLFSFPKSDLLGSGMSKNRSQRASYLGTCYQEIVHWPTKEKKWGFGEQGWNNGASLSGSERGKWLTRQRHWKWHSICPQPPWAYTGPPWPCPALGDWIQPRDKSREKVRRGQGLPQYICGEILNGQEGKINSPSHLSFTGRAAGATGPMGDQGGGTQAKASKKAPPYLTPLRPSSLSSLPGWQRRIWSLSILWKYISFITQTYVSSCLRAHFSESCSMEQAGFRTLKVGHLSLGASVPLSVNETPPLTLSCSLRC